MPERADQRFNNSGECRPRRSGFETTHWSMVLKASERSSDESEQALAELCQAYWLPIYAYIRRRVDDPNQAQDLTQTFFFKLLEKNYLQTADPAKGRFRAFMLTAAKRLVANQWDRDVALKRGGGVTLLRLDFDDAERDFQSQSCVLNTPEQLFLQDWARSLLDRVFEQIQSEFTAADKAQEFSQLKPFITIGDEPEQMADLAQKLGISVGAARVAVHRLRRRYRQVLRAEVAKTVRGADEVDDEIRSLFAAFG